MDKYRVTLTAEERVALEHRVSAGKAAARKLIHARVLLLADTRGEGSRDGDSIAALGTSPRTVARVRHQFVTRGLRAAIDRKAQPHRPDKIKIQGDVEQELIQLACSDPPEGRRHWTLRLLCDELVTLGLVRTASTEAVRQALKQTTSTPGSLRPGASRPRLTPSTSGGWRT
jgi:hypothetical protein